MLRTQIQLILVFPKKEKIETIAKNNSPWSELQNYYLLPAKKFVERVELCFSKSKANPLRLRSFFLQLVILYRAFQPFQHFCHDAVEEAAKEMRTISRSTILESDKDQRKRRKSRRRRKVEEK